MTVTEPRPSVSVLPLTDVQAGLLVAHRAYTNRTVYDVLVELELDPRHDGTAVRAALAGLLAVQPALRLGVHELPEPHATLEPAPAVADVPLVNVAVTTGGELEEQRRTWLDRLGATDFALDRPPLVRAVHLTAAEPATSVLLLCIHHTVFDGSSLESAVRDLSALLTGDGPAAGLVERRERALKREVDAQVAAATAASTDERARAWAERLTAVGDSPLYPLPGRSATSNLTGTRRRLPLPPELSAAIDDTCRRLSITPFVFFSAVLAAVVARHTAGPRVVLGTPVVSRRIPASYELCGLFVNTLPLLIDVDFAETFAAFARGAVQDAAAEVRRDAAVPWPRIVRHAAPDRASGRTPFFSCMIAMQDSTVVPPAGPVLAVREHGNGTAKLDLWLGVTPTLQGWLLVLEHDSVLPAAVVDGVERSLRDVLGGAVDDPDLPLSRLLRDAPPPGPGDGAPAPTGRLVDRLAEACREHSHRTAVEEAGAQLTHAELGQRAASVAAALRDRSVAPGDVVGLTPAALTDTVVAMLGVLRAGAAYLPLDPGLPAERLAGMLAQAGCRLVVGDADAGGVTAVPVRDLQDVAADPADPAAPPVAGPDGVYVMFTSGSTGRPKGVHMGNEPLVNLSDWQLDALNMGTGTRFLQYAPLGFDVSFQEIVPTLLAGGTVVGRGQVDRRDLPTIAQLADRAATTHMYLPVAALRTFASAAAGLPLEALRFLCVSGEQLVLDDEVRMLLADRPALRLVNLYGPTETHAVTTQTLAGPEAGPAHVPIGRPLPGVTAQVIDSSGHLAPTGVPGELLLGGRCPALGYLNDPEQTAARFVADPYGSPDGRRYRTGDQVLRDVRGDLVFLGRNDDQVKIRGHRVELGEVEAAALARLDVEQAVALVRGTGADAHLLLCVVPTPGRPEPGPYAIRVELARVLPAHMVPLAVVAVDAVPRTANGKIDRRTLGTTAGRLLAERRARRSPHRPAPVADPLEDGLSLLWAELLGLPAVEPEESLVELGAHSLTVLLALARVEADTGTRVPMLEFFREPTVTGLAALVRTYGEDR